MKIIIMHLNDLQWYFYYFVSIVDKQFQSNTVSLVTSGLNYSTKLSKNPN